MKKEIKATSGIEDVRNELKQIGIEFFSYWEAAVASSETIGRNNTLQGSIPETQHVNIPRYFRGRSDKNNRMV